MKYIVIHYGEIALKGRNRGFFENKLIDNIAKIGRIKGKIYRNLGSIIAKVEDAEEEQCKNGLLKVFGITSFSFAVKCKLDIKSIEKASIELLKGKNFKTFKVSAKRSFKEFRLSSNDINSAVGEYILNSFEGKKVNLSNPDIILFIEILKDEAFLYTEKIKGLGGLPVSSSGKVLSLISGGIDSPIASFLMQKRGASCVFAHFHAFPYTSQSSVGKVERIIDILSQYQGGSKLYLIPFGDIQKDIILKVPDRLRVLFYRRFMLKISQRIALKEKCLGLVSGDNLGQVASQTLESMLCVGYGLKLPIFRPLIGFDKEEIVQISKKINTYDISILPYDDCCSMFMPNNPETKPILSEFLEVENKIEVDKLIKKALKYTEVKII